MSWSMPASAARSRRWSSPSPSASSSTGITIETAGACGSAGGLKGRHRMLAPVPVTATRDEAPRREARRYARLRARPGLAASLAYALLALALVAPGLVPGRTLSASDYLWSAAPWQAERPHGVRDLGANYELADSVVQFQPWTQYLRARLPDAPLWNPYQGGGRPLEANAQSALFSPFTWPSLILPFWFSLAVAAALKLFVAAFGAFWLGRALGMGGAGAFLAGLAFGFGLWFVTWLSWPLDAVWAWLPWLLLLADRVVRRPSRPATAALALVVALQFFGGHPESSFHVLAVAALFSLLPLSRAGRGAPRAIGRLALGLGAGIVLAAVALLPFADLLRHSADLASREERQPVTVAFKYVLGLALPEYWGRPTGVISEPFVNARAWYVGALPLLLAGVALLRGGRERIAVAAAALAALLVATGVQPLFWIAHHVPGFSQSHNTRLGVVVALGLALLAGWGLDDLLRERSPAARRPRLMAVALAAAVALPVAAVALRAPAAGLGEALRVAWAFATPSGPEVLPRAALLIWLPLAGAGALVLWLRATGRLAPAAIALTAADLARAGAGQNPAIPVEHAEQPATGAIRYLQARAPGRFTAVGTTSVVPPIPPNVAMRYRIADARAYDYPVEERYATFWEREIQPRVPLGFTPAGATANTSPRALRALGLLGVTDVLQPPGERPPPGLRPAYEGRDATVYANEGAVPRAFVVGRARVAGTPQAALDAVTDPAFDARAEAIVEQPVGELGGSGSARIDEAAPERMRVTAAMRGAGLLVTADAFLPGWRATVDGRAAPLERVDYLLRGVRVPAGTHRLEFSYEPWSWTAGWIISLLAALALAAWVLAGRRRS